MAKSLLKPGDRVRGCTYPNDAREYEKYIIEGTIPESWTHNYDTCELIDVVPIGALAKRRVGYISGLVWTSTLHFANLPLDLNKKIAQRCGRPAVVVVVSNNKSDRPIRAKIYMSDGSEREFSFQATGLFYRSIPSDIDLVNV